jgi:hypothetical protein
MAETMQSRRNDVSKADIEAALARLADELGRVPNSTDWDDWSEGPCHKSNIGKRYDSWTAAIAAAGLPVVAPNTSAIIRQIAYQRPELAGRPSEVHDK